MMKYFVVACLLLTVALVQAQDQETTTDKRVERDVNIQDMPQIPGFPMEAMMNMARPFTEGMKGVADAIKDSIPMGANGMGIPAARRRRAAQQNQQPPKA